MNAVLWPCDICRRQGHDTPGVRNIAAQGYCTHHLTALYTSLDPSVWVSGGVGIQTGPLRPEYGPLEADLTCCRCQATWTGTPGDPCWWCQRSFQIQAEMQAETLLRPPEIDPDDIRYKDRMGAWAQRMKVGVDAELITRRDAELAWARAIKKATAA